MKRTTHKPQYSAPALEKGLDIVEHMAYALRPLTISEICFGLRRSMSQVFRYVRVLEERGYLQREPDSDRFAVTNKLFAMGMRLPPVADLLAVAYPVMQETAEAIEQSLHLCVANADEMVVVARVESPAPVGFAVRLGHHRNLVESASGRVLLAFAPERAREAMIARALASADARWTAARLARSLRAIRRRGYEHAESARVIGIYDASFPVFGDGRTALASLTTPLIRRRDQRVAEAQAIAALSDAAARIGAALAVSRGAA